MPPFPKPRTRFTYDLALECQRLRAHRAVRGIPHKAKGTLLIGSWNIANLGQQLRRGDDLALIAEVLSWFDVIAVQECRENFADLYDIAFRMGKKYRVVMSDPGGNHERLAFVYDSRKLALLDEIGEVTVAPAAARHIKVVTPRPERSEGPQMPAAENGDRPSAQPTPSPLTPPTDTEIPTGHPPFQGFDRPPYLAAFHLVGTLLSVQLVNVHLFFGSPAPADVARRALETAAIARWADLRNRSPYAGARELIAIGDFNMPKGKRARPAPRLPRPAERRRGSGGGDSSPAPTQELYNPVYDALTSRGLVLPLHSGLVGSSIASDNFYDQVALFPTTTKKWFVQMGVFDFDKVVFPELWARGNRQAFNAYLRYYLSDHRPMWVEVRPPSEG